MDVVIIITKVAQSAQHLLPHMCEDSNATRQLHCQRRCGPADAKHAAKVQNAAAITFYAF